MINLFKTASVVLMLLSISCEINSNKRLEKVDSVRKLKYVSNNINNNNFVSFDSIGLKKTNFAIYRDEDLVLQESFDYNYFYEVFDNKYLIISTKKKGLTSWSGLDTVTKDSVIIADLSRDLKKTQSKYVLLKNMIFVGNKNDLVEKFNYYSGYKMNSQNTYRFAIDSIVFDRNEIFIVYPNLEVKKHILKEM